MDIDRERETKIKTAAILAIEKLLHSQSISSADAETASKRRQEKEWSHFVEKEQQL